MYGCWDYILNDFDTLTLILFIAANISWFSPFPCIIIIIIDWLIVYASCDQINEKKKKKTTKQICNCQKTHLIP